jgi:CBS domain-containing protein
VRACQEIHCVRCQYFERTPVCDAARHVIGTITDRDITIRVVASHEDLDRPIEMFMTNGVVACRSSDDLSYAQERMSQEKVSRIMCIDEAGNLEGVISLSDLAQLEDGVRAYATLSNVSGREARI